MGCGVKAVVVGVRFTVQRAFAFKPTRAFGEELASRARKAAAMIESMPAEAVNSAD
jgi:hypothetical protein